MSYEVADKAQISEDAPSAAVIPSEGTLVNTETVPLTKEGVAQYLDGAIRSWRANRNRESGPEGDAVQRVMAEHYVDAFQSMRSSLLGEILGADK